MNPDSRRCGKTPRSTFGVALLAAALIGCERERTDLATVSALVPHPSREPGTSCRATSGPKALPLDVRESSGLALSRRSANLLWTHNDAGNDPVLFATDTSGRLIGRLAVSGARLVDWEDLQTGPCKSGDCLFIGDIGDNDGKRASVTVYVVPEPEMHGGDARAEAAEAIELRYPDGPQDAEAFFLLPSGALFIVTKGRDAPIVLYRASVPTSGSTAQLERVRELRKRPSDKLDRVTGASASPDGKWVALRTYRSLHLYRTADLLADGPRGSQTTDLAPLGEPKGEAVALSDPSAIWLSSEAGGGSGPSVIRLDCIRGEGDGAPG